MKVPKATITKVGGFDKMGRPVDWEFEWSDEDWPNSVGVYWSSNAVLYSGYTVEELKNISENRGEK